MKFRINAKQIVKDFGGMTATARTLTEAGVPFTRDAVDKWRRNGRVPSPHLCALALIAKKRGQRFELLDYIIEEAA